MSKKRARLETVSLKTYLLNSLFEEVLGIVTAVVVAFNLRHAEVSLMLLRPSDGRISWFLGSAFHTIHGRCELLELLRDHHSHTSMRLVRISSTREHPNCHV